MQKFRECEKETKTKAFSKEGLRQPSKQTPEDVFMVLTINLRKKERKLRMSFVDRFQS